MPGAEDAVTYAGPPPAGAVGDRAEAALDRAEDRLEDAVGRVGGEAASGAYERLEDVAEDASGRLRSFLTGPTGRRALAAAGAGLGVVALRRASSQRRAAQVRTARTNSVARTLHDLGLAAWFGGSLVGAVGVNGAAADVDDPRQRARVAKAGDVPVEGAAAPAAATPPEAEKARRQLEVLRWAIPALTGAVVVADARTGEQQRPTAALGGLAKTLAD